MQLKSYAKINLSLNVLGVREDGYHKVDTVMHRTSLCDIITMDWRESEEEDFLIEVSTNRPYIPNDDRNLAYRGALVMREKAISLGSYKGTKGGRLKIDIEKRIPVAAGLAGGSGNAAAVMIGLNRIWSLGLDTKALCELGKGLGSDVPFCILVQNSRYRCALGTGTGEELKPIKFGLKRYIVLAKPPFGVSTKEVYAGMDQLEIKERPDTQRLIDAISDRDYQVIYDNMINVLECYTLEAYPEVKKLKQLMIDDGSADKVLMSGSGPTVIGVFGKRRDAIDMCSRLRDARYEAYWTDTYPDEPHSKKSNRRYPHYRYYGYSIF